MAHSIIVDDMDPSISYEGSWMDTTAFIQSGGLPDDFQRTLFNSTLRGVLNPNTIASLSYSYTGTAFVLSGGILGDSDALNINCTVDGRPTSMPPMSNGPTNFFCKQDNLPDGQHTISLSISPTTANQQSGAWLDYIRYHPLNSAKAANNFQLISTSPDPKSITDVRPQNNQVHFNFSGNFITCLACLSDSSANDNSGYAMTLTIDGNSTPSFLIDKPIFCEQPLLDGEHQVRIDYKGPNDGSDFCKPGVVVGSNGNNNSDICMSNSLSDAPDGCGNSTSGIPTGSPSGSISPAIPSATTQGLPSSPDSTTSSSGVSDQDIPTSVAGHGAPIGAIVGGVIGGLALLVLSSALILVLLRRRRYLKNRALTGGSDDLILPDDTTIQTSAGDVVAQRRPRSSMHKSIPPPAMPQRSSIAKTRISWSQLNVDTGPQQTAQVGSDYGGSPIGTPRRESGFSLETKVEYHTEK